MDVLGIVLFEQDAEKRPNRSAAHTNARSNREVRMPGDDRRAVGMFSYIGPRAGSDRGARQQRFADAVSMIAKLPFGDSESANGRVARGTSRESAPWRPRG
jgi:hypothetical protein